MIRYEEWFTRVGHGEEARHQGHGGHAGVCGVRIDLPGFAEEAFGVDGVEAWKGNY